MAAASSYIRTHPTRNFCDTVNFNPPRKFSGTIFSSDSELINQNYPIEMPPHQRGRRRRRAKRRSRQSARRGRPGRTPLTKRTRRLERKMREQYVYSQWNGGSGGTQTGGPVTQHTLYKLIDPTDWSPLFDASTISTEMRKATVTSHRIQYLATVNTGTQVFQCMVACVSLKATVAQDVLQHTNNMTAMFVNNAGNPPNYDNNGKLWAQTPIGTTNQPGLYFLNKSIFNVHWMDHFLLGDVPYDQPSPAVSPVGNIKDANKWKVHTIKDDIKLEAMNGDLVSGEDGKWKNLQPNEIQDNKQRYLLFFCNPPNGSILNFRFAQLFNVKTLA